MKIRKDDTVVIVTGKDKGKKGNVRFAYPKDNRILVEGVNYIKMHSKAKRQVKQAGLIERESSIHVSNAMLLCSRCNHPVRVWFRVLEDGRKTRFCRSCGEAID